MSRATAEQGARRRATGVYKGVQGLRAAAQRRYGKRSSLQSSLLDLGWMFFLYRLGALLVRMTAARAALAEVL
jgi:hypothetical protein